MLVCTLVAAGVLIGILVSSWSINSHAATIEHRYHRVRENTELVRLADTTAGLARQIDGAVRPLSGELGTVRLRTQQILANARSIRARAATISTEAGSIDGDVRAIDGTVTAIRGTVSTIEAKVVRIHGGVVSTGELTEAILTTAGSIAGRAGSIVGHADSLVSHLAGVLPVSEQIRAGVAGSNQRVDRVITNVRQVTAALAAILVQAGRPRPGDPYGYLATGGKSINGHANAIDCNVLILGLHCGH